MLFSISDALLVLPIFSSVEINVVSSAYINGSSFRGCIKIINNNVK